MRREFPRCFCGLEIPGSRFRPSPFAFARSFIGLLKNQAATFGDNRMALCDEVLIKTMDGLVCR
jgi:hypothetical protein